MPTLTPASRLRIALGIFFAASCVPAHDADAMALHSVLQQPMISDLLPNDRIAFGYRVAMSATGNLLAISGTAADCYDQEAAAWVTDAGRVFIYRRVSDVYQYEASFCAPKPQQYALYGRTLAITGNWLVVGAYQHTQPMGADAAGQLAFYRYDKPTGKWLLHQTVNGIDAYARLGHDIAAHGTTIIAGESGTGSGTGRIRTWTTTTTSLTAKPHFTPPGLPANAHFGSLLAVTTCDPSLPQCFAEQDTMAAVVAGRVEIARRGSAGWVTSQSITPPAGFTANSGGVALSRSLLVFMTSQYPVPAGCASVQGTTVYKRGSGAQYAWFDRRCDALGTPANLGQSVAVNGRRVYAGAPDFTTILGGNPDEIGYVNSYSTDGTLAIHDTEVELGLGPLLPAPYPNFEHHDSYGWSMASDNAGYVAVGAPMWLQYTMAPGTGYVAVYKD